jgi:predicted transposase YbfD/YdcC
MVTGERRHGRIDKRSYYYIDDIKDLNLNNDWDGITSIGAVVSELQYIHGGASNETRYFITSVDDCGTFKNAVRNHWGIEKNLHWTLDVIFGEDKCRSRKGFLAEMHAFLRKCAYNILTHWRQSNKEKSSKCSLRMMMNNGHADINVLEMVFKQYLC